MNLLTEPCCSRRFLSALKLTSVIGLTLICAITDAMAAPPGYLDLREDDRVSHAVMQFLEDSKRTSLDVELKETLATTLSLSIVGPSDRRYGQDYWTHSFNPLDEDHADKLGMVLRAASSVKELTLSNFPASATVLATLPDMLVANKNLTSLGLYHLAQGRPGFEACLLRLPAITSLTSLGLGGDDYTDDVWPVLAQSLAQMHQLEELKLWDVGNIERAAVDAVHVLEAVATLSKLHYLDLSGNALGLHMTSNVSDTLRHLPRLTHLNLRALYFGDTAIQGILPAIDALAHLEWLDLGWNGFSDATQATLRAHFAKKAYTVVGLI